LKRPLAVAVRADDIAFFDLVQNSPNTLVRMSTAQVKFFSLSVIKIHHVIGILAAAVGTGMRFSLLNYGSQLEAMSSGLCKIIFSVGFVVFSRFILLAISAIWLQQRDPSTIEESLFPIPAAPPTSLLHSAIRALGL
jgi:hypothetical protein